MFLVMSLFVAYITYVLLFRKLTGPWESCDILLFDERDVCFGHPSIFDRIHRLFGLYTLFTDLPTGMVLPEGLRAWKVNCSRLPVWVCPKCLSAWTALLGSIPYVLFTGEYHLWIFVHGAMAFISAVCVFMVIQIEGTE